MSTHVDSYTTNNDWTDGAPYVLPETQPTAGEPHPLRHYPYSNGYVYFTEPHEPSECEAHRPTWSWVSREVGDTLTPAAR